MPKKPTIADVIKNLEELREPILSDETDLYLYGHPSLGLSKDMADRPVLLYGGKELGVVTNGFLMIESRKAADDLLTPLLEKARKRDPEEYAKNLEYYKGGAGFPDYKSLYPEKLANQPLKVIGYGPWLDPHVAKVPKEGVAVFLSDGEAIIPVGSHKLALVLKYLPGAKMYARAGAYAGYGPEKSIITFVVDSEKKGLLMPLAVEIPQKIRESVKKPVVIPVTPTREQILRCDERYRLPELQTMARDAGLIISGDKKTLCRRLIDEGAMKW